MPEFHFSPLGSYYVFAVSSSALINAPRDKSIKLPRNTFVRKMTIASASKAPLAVQTPAEGRHIHMTVHMPPTMDAPGWIGAQTALVYISSLDPVNNHAAWRMAGMPAFLLHAERLQALSADEATGKTRYETVEVFGGVLAYLGRFFVGEKLKVAFRAAADCLKARAE